MTAIFYLKEATTGSYANSAINYITNLNENSGQDFLTINDVAQKLDITSGVIAGALAEENEGFTNGLEANLASDDYAESGFDPQTFGDSVAELGEILAYGVHFASIQLSGSRTHEEWKADYDAAISSGGLIKQPNSLDKAYHPMYYDVGKANFRISTAIGLLISSDPSDINALGLDIYG